MNNMCCATTAEDIQNVFACYGVRFTIEEAQELLRSLKYNDGSELFVEDLDSVNGGGPVLLIGAAIYALALTVAHRYVAKTKYRRHFKSALYRRLKMTTIEKLDALKSNPEFARKVDYANSADELVAILKGYDIDITTVDAENILASTKKIIDAYGEIPEELLDDIHIGIAMTTLGVILVFTQIMNFACTIASIKLNSMRRR